MRRKAAPQKNNKTMKKTYNINIAGSVFTIDDDAYTLLNDYLETLQHVFHNTDNEEIIPDIENRIAEIFTIKVTEGKSVITLDDVESVISRIGKPEELMEVDETETVKVDENGNITEEENIEAGKKTVPPPYTGPQPDQVKKKLFRDSKDGMIGGVCAGLSKFLDFDVTWIRLIAVGLLLLSIPIDHLSILTLPIVYIILWIVLPDASTPLQRMQMKGDVPTLSNIGKSVTGMFRQSQSKNNAYGYDYDNERKDKRIADEIAGFFGSVGKICLAILLVMAIVLEVAMIVGFLGCIFGLVLLNTAWGSDLFGIPTVMNHFEYKEWMLGLMMAIGYIVTFGIPLYCVIVLVLSKNKKNFGTVTKIVMSIFWVIAFVLAAVCTGLFISNNEANNRHEQEIYQSEYEHEMYLNSESEEYTEDIYGPVDSLPAVTTETVSSDTVVKAQLTVTKPQTKKHKAQAQYKTSAPSKSPASNDTTKTK